MLFSPIRVGPFELRNRLITTGHGAFFPWNPADTGDQFIEYQRRRAAGGLGMMILQPLFVDPLESWPLMMAERMSRLAEAVHEEGARAVLQLVNFGGQMSANYNIGNRPLWSFNGMQAPGGEISHRMSLTEIDEMVAAFARAARVATEAGLDGVEIHGAHGYLVHQSYSRWGNDRTDAWGEPLAFTRSVLQATRQAIGRDKIIGFRMAEYDERPAAQGGMTEVELRQIGADVVELGEIDFLNTSIGSKAPDYAAIAVATYRTAPGHELELTRQMRAAIGGAVPVVGVGRILTPEQGEEALRRGDCDLVAMTRGHIADPDIAVKVRRGDSHRIRRCVGANECNDRKIAGLTIACMHNPDVGREGRGPVAPSSARREVLVVGAGPGGLKAAEIAALRGHAVTLVDAADEVGGHFRFVRATSAKSMVHVIEHLTAELALLGVEPQLRTRADRNLLERLRPDAVVVATGTRRGVAGAFDGAEHAGVLTSLDALIGERGRRVLVLDRLGLAEAALVAETMLGSGRDVVFATPFDALVPHAGYSHRKDVSAAFRRGGVRVITDADVAQFDGHHVELVDPDGKVCERLGVDEIVAVVAPTPELELLPVLGELGLEHHLIGDAVAPRSVYHAMREADDVARVL